MEEKSLINSKILLNSAQISECINKIASSLNKDMVDKNPVVLCVVKGAIVFSGNLLPLLNFRMELEYIHATRYEGEKAGAIQWKYKPDIDLNNRHVLILDDILDEGITLKTISDYCLSQGAQSVKSVVLLEKKISRPISKIEHADYCGIEIDDLFVFGYGLDLDGYWRNTKDIYFK